MYRLYTPGGMGGYICAGKALDVHVGSKWAEWVC